MAVLLTLPTLGYASADGPPLVIVAPIEGVTSASSVLVAGSTQPNGTVTIDGKVTPVNSTGSFDREVPLSLGQNVIEVRVVDPTGNATSVNLTITRTAASQGPGLNLDLVLLLVFLALAAGTAAGYIFGRLRKPANLRAPEGSGKDAVAPPSPETSAPPQKGE